MEMRLSKHEAALIWLIRRDGWPIFRALDTSLASMPNNDINHVPMVPGPWDAETLQKARSIVHTLMH